MRSIRFVLLLSAIAALLTASANAQQIRYVPDFTGASGAIQLNQATLTSYGNANVLRLTPPYKPSQQASTAYFKVPQPVSGGFFTYFSFQMHAPTQCCDPGDGFALILQNSNATDPTQGAYGKGITAVGAAMGGLGYSGINDSLAIEFDILGNAWDPNGNHIAIQTCGGNPALFNSPVHEPGTYTIGNNNDITSCLLSQNAINSSLPSTLGPTCNPQQNTCTDGPVHQVVIEYTPPMGENSGLLQVYLDPQFQPGSHVPIIGAPTTLSVPYDLLYSPSNPLGLQPANINTLLVGFSASVENGGTTTDILSWEFTPQAPSQITQPINMGGMLTDFAFGGHQLGVTYPDGFTNMCDPNNQNCFLMTVTATPVNQQTFYTQRLQGTNFANENCIIYLQTGGNCIDYSVTCSFNGQQVTCPTEPDFNIAICSQFETSQYVSQINTDFLEADPIGSNNWCSIWTSFQQQGGPATPDPIVSGKGQGFSDIVATLSPTGPGPSCQGGLNELTQTLQQTTNPPPPAPPPQGNFCPPVQ
jgi:Legume lectin domain